MFPRAQRLRRRKDIDAVLRRGRRFPHPLLMLRAMPSVTKSPRVTVVVGVAVSKRATVRNRLKRQLRHLLRQQLNERNATTIGMDLMVSPRAAILKEPSEVRAKALAQLLDRIYPKRKP
ncbi:ribonuclease P protein component [Candidatus Uhrbacteria bacterium CG10_big_fil_rev_8_21_14_0_10_48_11]|uniref:Ribonuclease P protein component n=1 Tax=Candidatus Uhrbacteria bacterium CG10_big_fil_rev_8_21_14_0_10_48_11 TaxID=1975037 RepID=A0A2M8LE53_9BACT|nr:MAG: ribonuclease P protein component [Candidatus Uhrbacteria bacterium CG10_big_fil_rev_8_21_14_0_10_48_11]